MAVDKLDGKIAPSWYQTNKRDPYDPLRYSEEGIVNSCKWIQDRIVLEA